MQDKLFGLKCAKYRVANGAGFCFCFLTIDRGRRGERNVVIICNSIVHPRLWTVGGTVTTTHLTRWWLKAIDAKESKANGYSDLTKLHLKNCNDQQNKNWRQTGCSYESWGTRMEQNARHLLLVSGWDYFWSLTTSFEFRKGAPKYGSLWLTFPPPSPPPKPIIPGKKCIKCTGKHCWKKKIKKGISE